MLRKILEVYQNWWSISDYIDKHAVLVAGSGKAGGFYRNIILFNK